jgi:hypothetical protein
MQPNAGSEFGTVQTPATRSSPPPALHSPTLRHVISPALAAVGGQDANAAVAASDVVKALAVLESISPGACVSFVGQLMTAAVGAPIAGGGELEQLRRLAGKLGEAVQRGVLCFFSYLLLSRSKLNSFQHCYHAAHNQDVTCIHVNAHEGNAECMALMSTHMHEGWSFLQRQMMGV